MATQLPEGPTINQVLDEFLADQEGRLAARTYRQYESVIELLGYCVEDYATLTDPALDKTVDEARRAGIEDAVCRLCPPTEIASCIDDFLGWFMVRKVFAGQDLMRAAATVTRRLGKWLYEHSYIDANDAKHFLEETTRLGRALPKATALRDRLAQWVDNQPAVRSAEKYEGHFQIVAITDRGWTVEDRVNNLHDDVLVPAELRHPQQVYWEVETASVKLVTSADNMI